MFLLINKLLSLYNVFLSKGTTTSTWPFETESLILETHAPRITMYTKIYNNESILYFIKKHWCVRECKPKKCLRGWTYHCFYIVLHTYHQGETKSCILIISPQYWHGLHQYQLTQQHFVKGVRNLCKNLLSQ